MDYEKGFKNGRAEPMTFDSVQLIDIVPLNFSDVSENPKKLAALRVEKQLSMRELAEATGHTRPYLRRQLRKFGIRQENQAPRLASFGWDWKDTKLVENPKEQVVLREIVQLNKVGQGCKSIASELNRRSIKAKAGGCWWSSSVQNILNRRHKKQE